MAGGITESVVEEIKSRIDIADLIASYGVAIKTAGSSKKACCPFHHEKTPSFNINETKGYYHCFGCGESGDAIKFVQKMDGLSFVEAVKKLAGQCGVEIVEKEDPDAVRRKRVLALLAEVAQFYRRCLLKAKEGELARAYLKERDLGEKIQEDYLIGYAPSGIANIRKWAEKYKYTVEELEAAGIVKAPTRPGDLGYHRFGGRLMFSIRDKQGRVVGFSGRQLVASKNSGKYVNSPETVVFRKKQILYGFDKAMRAIAQDKKNHEVIVCEGQIDCIRLQTCGFPNAVAGQGTAFTEDHAAMLKKVADLVTLVYDDDGAGHKATIKSARLCLAAELPVRVVSLPGGDDPDSFLRTHPAEEFRKMLENAESIMSFQVRAERAKEANPDSVDAVARMTREILLTIAQCPNEVIKAAMTGEAAKLLGLPSAALAEELRKVKAEPVRVRPPSAATTPEAADDDFPGPADESELAEVDESFEGERAAEAIPPPPKEMALMAFLMANEYDRGLDGDVGAYLPREVFAHAFTVRFVETWRTEVAKGEEDLMGGFAAALPPTERAWFDAVLLAAGKTEASELSTSDILHDFVRALWSDVLRRRRGALPAAGDPAADLERMKLTMDLKRLARVKWHDVKEMVEAFVRDGLAGREPSSI